MAFDADKEHFIIFHKLDPYGHTFKHLGTLIDPKLVMDEEVQQTKNKVHPKVKAILVTRKLYDTKGMIQQYKTHILCLLKQSSGAISHASEVPLHPIDHSRHNSFARSVWQNLRPRWYYEDMVKCATHGSPECVSAATTQKRHCGACSQL